MQYLYNLQELGSDLQFWKQRKEEALLINRKKQKCQSATLTWQHDK